MDKVIAFTFDDAPEGAIYDSENCMCRIIDEFKKYNASGTFFVLGKKVVGDNTDGIAYGDALLKYAIQNGFELGNHSFSHAYLTELSVPEIRDEIEKTNKIIKDVTNTGVKWFRPGYGAVNKNVFKVATEFAMPVVMGNRYKLALDYKSDISPDYVKDIVINCAYDGQIVLLHCWSKATADCIGEILSTLNKQGYRFVTLSELFNIKGIKYDSIPTDRVIYDTTFI